MNIVHYSTTHDVKIVYIIIDKTHTYQCGYTKELIKNISDYTISSVWSKMYDVIVGLDEDELLSFAADQNYKFAVVLTNGTEFINGDSFFQTVENLTTSEFFIAGHILDRKEAYYELHHQCYIINLEKFNRLGRPEIGRESLGRQHYQCVPHRSHENIHDDYTPIWVSGSDNYKNYQHKLHGWNILGLAFEKNETVIVFDDKFRNNKKYYYPENQREFLQHIQWAHSRERYCSDDFIHTENTEYVDVNEKDFECVITPASGAWFIPFIATDRPVNVIYYDYNQKSLDYWKEHAPRIENVTYEFVRIDLLGMCNYDSILGTCDRKTLFNVSNIFCYEGTSMFSNLAYRLFKENELLRHVPKHVYTFFNSRSCIGFIDVEHQGRGLEPVSINKLLKPTWHINQDWI
jgi:hypothetical protein